MPIIKSAKKKLRQNRKRAVLNSGTKSLMRNAIKDFNRVLASDSSEAAKKFPRVQKLIDTAAKKRVIPAQRASRSIGQLKRALNTAGSPKK